MGHPERLERLPAGAGAGGGIVNHGGNLEAARPHDPEYWARKTQAKDLKNAKTFLQQGLLTADRIEQFDT